jgi:NitT/TauT family transport system permease protein
MVGARVDALEADGEWVGERSGEPVEPPGFGVDPAAGGGSRLRVWALRVRYYLPAIVVAVAVLVLWEVAISSARVQRFILPPPSAILAALGSEADLLRRSALATLSEAVGGLLVGTTLGLLVAFVSARFASFRDALLPVAVAANAVPIIALAPVFNNWFGIINPASKIAIVAVLVFFPVMINVARGLTQVDAASLELMRSYAASEFEILRRVRIPNALPYFFTALKVSSTLSLIGAIVGEYFGGSSEVIGRVVVQSASRLRFDITWAAILLGALTGIVFYLIIVLLERLVIPWHASQRSVET